MRPTVLLLGVEHPGNLGAVARAMMNFGFTELVLIEPKCSPADKEALNRAVHAKSILQNATSGGLELLDGYDLVVGFTGKTGDDYNLRRTPLLPEQLLARLAEADDDAKVALLFGRESDGLMNHELDRCDIVIRIPTTPDYPSINLSHAVAIALYELGAKDYEGELVEGFPLLRAPERRALERLIGETTAVMGFPAEEENLTQQVLWKRLVGKSMITQREAMALMGFLRRVRWLADRAGSKR